MDRPDYENYKVEDFVSNEYFRFWVLHESEECENYWQSWLNKNPDKSDLIEAARQIVLSESKEEVQQERMWSDIESQVGEPEEAEGVVPKKTKNLKKSFFREHWKILALVLLVLLAVAFYLKEKRTELRIRKGEERNYVFPDGSEVNINADSKLYFEKKEWGNKRMVHFDGEAYFQMAGNEPFLVVSSLAELQVKSRNFNIFSRGTRLVVDCFEGQITVKSLIHNVQRTITAGQGIIYTEDLIDTYSLGEAKVPAWIFGNYIYNDAPLNDVLREIERQYDVNLKVAVDLSQDRYSGEFNNRNLIETLSAVCDSVGLKYEFYNSNQVLITEK